MLSLKCAAYFLHLNDPFNLNKLMIGKASFYKTFSMNNIILLLNMLILIPFHTQNLLNQFGL